MKHLFSKRKFQLFLLPAICLAMFTGYHAKAQTNWNFAAPTDGAGTSTVETGKGICTDASGNVYMSGVFNGGGSPTDFDLSVGGVNSFVSAGNDGYIASYDKNGNFRWKVIVSGTGSDFANFQTGICTNGTYVWVTGSATLSGAPTIASSTNTVTITSTGGTNSEAIVAKMNCSNGAVQWVTGFGNNSGIDAGQGIAVDPNGCCYVIGCYSGTFTLNSITAPPVTGGTSTDLFVAKFNPAGALIHFASGGCSAVDMQLNSGGICYVPGATPAIVGTGSFNYGTGTATYGTFTVTNSGTGANNDMLLLELDTTLTFTNAIGMGSGGTTNDEIMSAVYDPFSGGVYVSGFFNAGGITVPGVGALPSAGGEDIFVARYSVASNNFTWAKSAGGTLNDRSWSIAADGQGGIIVGASSASNPCTFSGSVSVNAGTGANDIVVAHYNTAGTPLWALATGNTGVSGDDARGVACYVETTPSYVQNVFVTGDFQNTITFNTTTLVADGAANNDFFLARINDLATPLSATQSQVNLTCNGVCTGSATVVASGGTAPYTYSWSPSGGSGATASSLCATNYTCTITDASSTSITKTFSITQPSAIVVTPISQTNVACFGGSNGAAQVTSSGGTGTLTYNWTPGNPTGDGTGSVTGLTAQVYTVTVTDANSCTATRTFNITAPSAISVTQASQTNVACFGGSSGAASINTPTGGAGGYTYNWTPGNPTGDGTVSVTGLTAGTWTCTVTDANACTATATFNITAPSAISVTQASQTNISCFGGSNGAASINTPTGGAGGYTYNWTPGNPTGDGTVSVTGLTAGTWTCTVTDANACTATATFNITSPSAISVTQASQTNISCFGGSNGAASINTPTGGAGGYTYNWTPGNPTGDGTVSVTGLTAQVYTVTVTDANSCTATATFNVTQPTSPVSGTTVVTNVACFGGSNGAINLTPTGGTPGYTFNWLPSGPTTEDRTGLTAGTYSVQITDANGCTGTVTATVTQPTSPVSGTTVVTNVACFGGSNGAINLTPTGGTPGYTFNWLPSGPTTEDRTGLTAGTYSVQITDANGCTGTVTATVTQPTSPVSGTTVVTSVSCFGGSNGAIDLTPTGGSPGYTYQWLPSGPTTQDRTSLAAGTYSVQITDANGCTGTVTATVTQPTLLTVTISTTNILCNSTPTGSMTATPSGGSPSYTYFWTPGNATTPTINNLPAQCYTVLVTDSHGCTATATSCVAQPPAIAVTPVSQTNVSCNGGSNGTASVTASGGTGTLSYNWTPGNPTGDGTNAVTGLTTGSWTCTVTDANGCTATATFNITQPPVITVSPASQTNVSCNGGSNGAASVTASGGTGTLSYNWTPGNPTGDGTNAVTGLTQGTWTCTVTDANSCTSTQTILITEPPALAVSTMQTNVSCNGGNNGVAMVMVSGGTPGYTYSWTPTGGNGAMATGLIAGSYTCVITDANSCTFSQTFSITEPPALTSSNMQTNVSCNGGNNGDAMVMVTGGTGSFTYSWAPSGGNGAMATGLTAGNYSCLITDGNGCTLTETFLITEPPVLNSTNMQTDVTCNGGNNGSATATATGGTGPYTYLWAPGGGTAPTEPNLSAGTYTVTITDANSCTHTETFTITEPPALTFTTAQTNVSCNGGNNGDATVSVSGGTGSYTYAWLPSGGTGAMEMNLTAGNYSCTITDANSCQVTATFTITEPGALSVVVDSLSNPTGCGASDGSIFITASGGSPSYTYSWSNSSSTEDVTGIPAGSYTCTITDANGCVTTASATLSDPNAPVVTVSIDTTLCVTAGLYTLTEGLPSGGTWSGNTVSGNTFDPAAAGIGSYQLTYTYTDTNGCTASASDTMLVDACLGEIANENPDWNLFPNPTNGMLTISPISGKDKEATVEVFGMDGKLILSEQKGAGDMTIDLHKQPVGIYFIRITTAQSSGVYRVTKI